MYKIAAPEKYRTVPKTSCVYTGGADPVQTLQDALCTWHRSVLGLQGLKGQSCQKQLLQ